VGDKIILRHALVRTTRSPQARDSQPTAGAKMSRRWRWETKQNENGWSARPHPGPFVVNEFLCRSRSLRR